MPTDAIAVISQVVLASGTLLLTTFTFLIVWVGRTQLRNLNLQIGKAERTWAASVLLNVYEFMYKLRPMWQLLYQFSDDYRYWTAKELRISDCVSIDSQRLVHLCKPGLIDEQIIIES